MLDVNLILTSKKIKVKQNEKVFYACLNQKKSSAPEHIKDKGIYIAGDLAETLRDLKENIAGKEM